MKSGIYIIKNTQNGLCYIGQSVNIKQRRCNHKNLLLKNKHNNTYLQRHFNKYGRSVFVFDVIEWCDIDKLDEREQYWINYYNSMDRKYGYNREGGGNTGKIVSEETRQKKIGKNNPQYGTKRTAEWLEMIKIHNRANSDKLTEKDIEEIKLLYLDGVDQRELSDKYHVEFCTINKIIKCKNWYWVRNDLEKDLLEYPEKKKKILSEKIINMYNDGIFVRAIAKELKTSTQFIKKVVLNNGIHREVDLEKRNAEIINDFNNGMPKNEIMSKYNISKTSYVRITHEEFNRKKQEKIEKVRELKSSGMTNKAIAEILNLHTCTVKEYLAKVQVNTEVSGKTTRHRNA